MKNEYSKHWKSSTKPNKQRKYRFNAPLHIKGKFLHSHLSTELRKKYNLRSIRIVTGDKVKILRGQFKKLEGKVERVNVKKTKIYVQKAELPKKDGSKAFYPIDPSNVLIVELNTNDKKRVKKLQSKNDAAATKNKK